MQDVAHLPHVFALKRQRKEKSILQLKRHLIYFSLFYFSSFMLCSNAFSQYYFESHTNARALGMGNAFSSLVDDEESLFYNPAGIAKNGGVFWTVADPRAGITDITKLQDQLEAFDDLQTTTGFQTALNSLYGEPILANGGGKTAVIMPFFSAAYYVDYDVGLLVDNPASPTLTLNYTKDTGIALGTGFSLGPFLQMGFAAKRIEREGTRDDYGPSVIADIVGGSSTPDVIFDNLENKGVGYALDMGMNLTIPLPVQPTLSFVWKNIGNTSFTADAGEPSPPSEKQEWVLGGSLMVDAFLVHIVPSLEFKHINDEETQLGKKVHLGVELGIPFVDLRAGLHQGYLSYGVGLDIGPMRIDAASYGVEVGGYPGQLEARQYMVQATIRFGLDLGFGSSIDGKDGSGSKQKSSWKRKLKQRR